MSGYLTFYLVPKKTKKFYSYNDGEEKEVESKLSEGLPLTFMTYTRSSNIYQAFDENLSIAFCGKETKYTDITLEDVHHVYNSVKNEIQSSESRLEVDYKILKDGGYSSELWEQIHSTEDFLKEQRELLAEIQGIVNIVSEVADGYTDFEKVVANIG